MLGCSGAVDLVGFWVGGLWGLIGKALLCRMLWIMFSSCWYSSCFRLYESSLLNRNLTVAYLWCVGVVGVVGDDGVRECGFSVYDGSNVCGGSLLLNQHKVDDAPQKQNKTKKKEAE